MAAQAGQPTLIVEVEGKSGIGAVFGRREVLGYEEEQLADHVKARTLTPDDALLEYLADHGMKRISKRLTQSGALDVVSTAVPGIKDILVLGKVKQLERATDDLLVLDAPAAGHAVTFLTSAAGLLDAARVGPIRAQAQDVVDLLSDPERCQVVLVTLPEETPVNEVIETAYKLEDKVGIKLGPVVVNGLYPRLEGLDDDPPAGADLTEDQRQALKEAAEFRRSRQDLQAEQVARLREELPLPQLHLPFLFTPEVGPEELDVLAAALAEQVGRL
jgi:anion-transporting  ArsA/GET3 family ATPase